ncbi:MAG: hypothetical protein NC489_07965 [Ruminococcus flavefaciens]|nr:hypothetical protein [Ruminococcus flavefaciens]
MSNKFIDIKQTTDVAELQARVRELEESLSEQEEWCDKLIVQSKQAGELLDIAQRRIEQLEELVGLYQQTVEQYERLTETYSSDCTFRPCYDSGSPKLTHGIGMSYDKDAGAKVYRVSDPDGPLIPELEFKKAEFEIGRGEGIHFGIRWNKKR